MGKYWCVNFDGVQEILEHGLEENLWLMQYQYNAQRTGLVTANWNVVGKTKVGDWCVAYLKGPRFYAIGRIVAPRKSVTHYDTIQRTVDEKEHHYKDGIVHYTDASAFYEDFTDEWEYRTQENGRWVVWKYPQRIDVEEWRHIKQSGIYLEGLGPDVRKMGSFCRTAAFQISEQFFTGIRNALR